MSKLYRWSIVSLLTLIVIRDVFSFSVVLRNELKCPSVTHCECSISTHYEIACPNRIDANITLRVEPQQSTNRVEIECNSDDSEILDNLPEWNIGAAETVKFNGCPTTANTTIDRVFQRLGIRNVRTLIFFARITSDSPNKPENNTLPEQLFANIENVTSLYLRLDKMHLPWNIFQSFHNLEYLQISSADLSSSSDGIFRNLSKLKRLHLWNNDLRNLTKEMFVGIASLVDLEISSNDIDELSSDLFTHLTAVESIDLNGNRMNAFPQQLFNQNKALQKIRINGNHLKSNALPAKLFGQLPQLEAIWINNCNLTSLPTDLFVESTNLRNISLANNYLTSIPTSIFHHQSDLFDLDMSFNHLFELDDGLFSETTGLTVLRLSHNRLSNISSDMLSELVDLQELYLDNNNLHTVHMAAFDHTNIKVLHLQNNHLDFKNIEDSAWDFERASPFQKLSQLEVLNMRNNSMQTFLIDWQLSNVALRELDVSYNRIGKIHFPKILNKWNDDIVIDLSHNQISKMIADKDFRLNQTKSQITWILNDNPLNCDCLVVHFLSALRKQVQNNAQNPRIEFITHQLKCASPQRFAKQPLETVPLAELICPLDRPYVNGKHCPDKCVCFVRTFDSAAVFNCSNANLTKVPTLPNIKGLSLQFYELHIENNNISTLATANSTGYDHVHRIFAKNNSIERISTTHLPNNLLELDLSANKLKRISANVLLKLQDTQSLRKISFGQNPWICDCGAYELLHFIKNHYGKILDINEITCHNDKTLSLVNSHSNLCPITKTTILIIAMIAIAVFAAPVLLLTTLFYKNREEIMVWLFAHNQFAAWLFDNTSKSDEHKKYDAFILYGSSDEKFVVENLVPQLENGPKPLKICLLMREMQCGDYIPEQITTYVEQSRRTIVVLTPNFIEFFKKQSESKTDFPDLDIWAFGGFRMAHGNALKERRQRVIIIKKGNIGSKRVLESNLRAYLNANIHLQWDEESKQPEKTERRFFNKLRLAIEHPKYFKSQTVDNCEHV